MNQDDLSRGRYRRYKVEKLQGENDPDAEYFVLRIDNNGSDQIHVTACQEALLCYAKAIRSHIPLLAADLETMVAEYRARAAFQEYENHVGRLKAEIRKLEAECRRIASATDQ